MRERGDDIAALVSYFALHFARRMGKRIEAIPAEALDAMRPHRWPGNVRELAASGVKRTTLQSRMQRLGIRKPD
ncbi:MAG TPA: hypothetical protein VFB33_17760 [Candidatus Binataceae bacterium]|nr:hypothetical protein [Candidatus Binataceae bacterium]